MVDRPARRLTYFPVALALVLVLPRLLSAHFGLFDDAITLRVAGQLAEADWSVLTDEAATGRFRPTYWLQYGMVFAVVGAEPIWFFLWNAMLLGVLTALVICLVTQLGGDARQGWLTGVLFVVSGPIIENLYTLSKPELLQAVMLIAGLLLGTRRQPNPRRGPAWAGILAGQATLLLLAITTKETALVMVPISVAWFGLAAVQYLRSGRSAYLYPAVALALAAVMAGLAYLALRSQYLPTSLMAGTYSNNLELSAGRLRDSAIRWAGWLVRDFAYLAPLVPLLLDREIRRRLKSWTLVVGAAVWTGAWIAIYLPWEFTVEYYMLPVGIGACVFAGAVLSAAWESKRAQGTTARRWTWAALATAGMFWLTTLPNQYSNARQQLAVDGANAGMLEFVASEAPDGGTVLINIQQANEYTFEIDLHLREVRGRPDLTVEPYDPSRALGRSDPQATLIALPTVQSQPLLAVRMGVIETTQATWNRALMEAIGGELEQVYRIQRGFRLTIIDLPRLLCPLLQSRGYCREPRPLVDLREFSYGWEVSRWPEGTAP